ncbi:hypothetical protein DFA_04081 [Cavenderia fasciculata]|uniref:Ankyrin repeat-containing protein n=1 Tax=Cavenderia fasciculata TaxID=261658 RepID=F4Q186_CACFS|nr:uncharacterized protein DFA_04081 [Cavenderia fasciculata]EGG18587.1 hypothetical protein DFA_04081 [Cavenderia fasciculata]|eukprot:XP_004366491.1 hypothetical protein DFA_04081 [Cavenderia fasciculata]
MEVGDVQAWVLFHSTSFLVLLLQTTIVAETQSSRDDDQFISMNYLLSTSWMSAWLTIHHIYNLEVILIQFNYKYSKMNILCTDTTTTLTPSFLTIFRITIIRTNVFKKIEEISKQKESIKKKEDQDNYVFLPSEFTYLKGKDIVKLPHLGMISVYAMPWDFIKHYLPPMESVLATRRMYAITQYCSHKKSSLETLKNLLEWSPDYKDSIMVHNMLCDPETSQSKIMKCITSAQNVDILEYMLERFPGISLQGSLDHAITSTGCNIDFLKVLHNKGATCTQDAMDNAASYGYLDAIIFLNENRTEGCSTNAIHLAAYHGFLDVVKYLHFNRTEGCMTKTMNWAAINDHFEIVKFLHFNRTEGCTFDAMDGAAESGNLDMLKFFHENRSEGCSEYAMTSASRQNHFNIVKWLHENRTEECTHDAMDLSSSLEITTFLHSNRTEGATTRAVVWAAGNGNIDILKFLNEKRTEGGSPSAIDMAVSKNQSLEVIQFLHDTFKQGCTITAVECAIEKDRLDIIQFLHQNYPSNSDIWTFEAMEIAAQYGCLEILKFLHSHRTEGCTTEAMDLASRHGHLEVVKFLHFNRSEGCTTGAIDCAAQRGYLEIVEFLHKHRTEGCTPDAMWINGSLPQHVQATQFLIDNNIVTKNHITTDFISHLSDNYYYEVLDIINRL